MLSESSVSLSAGEREQSSPNLQFRSRKLASLVEYFFGPHVGACSQLIVNQIVPINSFQLKTLLYPVSLQHFKVAHIVVMIKS